MEQRWGWGVPKQKKPQPTLFHLFNWTVALVSTTVSRAMALLLSPSGCLINEQEV